MASAGNTVRGIEAGGDVTAQGDIHVNISHTTVQSNNCGIPVSSFRIVDAPINIFEGRQELLAKIHEALQARAAERAYMKKIVALVAMGGMGKTETVRKLVDVYMEHYKNVAWVDAETESSATQSFVKIAEVLGISHPEDIAGQRLAERVYRHISEHVKEPSIFIFDNTNRLKTDGDVFGIFHYLPTQSVGNPPMVLLTSQTAEWGRHCAVLDVTEMKREESLNFFKSRFKITDEEIQEDTQLRELLESLMERLNGYPLALGLAAANVSFIPGQGSMELLKRNLKKYIECVDNKKFLEQRVDTQLATDYGRTLSAVWHIAMDKLERQEFAMEAKYFLSILAHVPQGACYHAAEVYREKNANLGITFPDKQDEAFEDAALNALQTVGIARVGMNGGIRVHRLVQELARLGDQKKIGIQKLSLYSIQGSICDCLTLCLHGDDLWSDEGICSWALENDCTVLLWLNALRRQIDGGRGQGRSVNDGKWKNQLEKFRGGADFAVVAEFILNHKGSYPNRRDAPPPDELWSCIMNAVEAKSMLVGNCKETRAFLELVLLLVIQNTLDPWCDSDKDESAIEQTAVSLIRLPPQHDAMLASFRKWLSEFDFSSAIDHYSAHYVVEETLDTLEKFRKLCTLAGNKIQLVSTKAWLKWAEAMQLSDNIPYVPKSFLVSLGEAFDTELLDEPWVVDHVLNYLPGALLCGVLNKVTLGVLRKLVMKRNLAQLVIADTSVMNSLKLHNLPFRKKPLSLYRFRSSEETRRRLPGVPAGVLASGDDSILNVYSYIIVCLGLCTNPSLAAAEAKQTLMKLLPVEKCERCTECLAEYDLLGGYITDFGLGGLCLYGNDFQDPHCFTKCDLDEDQTIVSRTLDWLLYGTEPPRENSWGESLVQLIKTVQKVNQRLLSWMLDTSEGCIGGRNGEDSALFWSCDTLDETPFGLPTKDCNSVMRPR